MVHGIHGIQIPNFSYNLTQNGKMSLPVDPSFVIYSHFEHVSGIPAQEGIHGVSISKLKLLDVLIGRLNEAVKAAASNSKLYSLEGIDSLIESYLAQLQKEKAASSVMPYIPSPDIQPGVLFTLIS